MTSHRSFLFVVDCYVQLFNSPVFQCDDMVSKCREMTSRSKPWFEVATQVVFFPTEEQSTTPKGGRYFSGSLGIQLPRLFGDGPMIAGKTYRVLFWFLCVDCIMLQSSFTWDEIAFEHVQCVIDDTGFRFKGTSWSEARIKLSPMDVEYDHLCWPSTFHFSWETMDLSECDGSWKFVVVHYFQEAIWIGSVKEGTSKDWT